MNALELLAELECGNNAVAYQALLELERLSEQSDAVWPFTEKFAQMAQSDKYAVRVRGFRLFCKQAKWDRDGVIDRYFQTVLPVLNDKKPTAVRQALAALTDIVTYKPELRKAVRQAVESIDVLHYKDSMQGLIYKDIQSLIRQLDSYANNE